MTTLADKAREALEGATPGPWEVHHNEHHPGALTVEGPTIRCLGFTIASDVDEKGALQRIRDANLIALAPDLARAYLDLLAERDRLRKAGDNLANAAEHGVAISDAVTAWDNTRAALKQEGDQ